MATLKTSVYANYPDAYNDMVSQLTNSTLLSPAQRADCLEALATIAPYPTPTGTITSTPPVINPPRAPIITPPVVTVPPVVKTPPVINTPTPVIPTPTPTTTLNGTLYWQNLINIANTTSVPDGTVKVGTPIVVDDSSNGANTTYTGTGTTLTITTTNVPDGTVIIGTPVVVNDNTSGSFLTFTSTPVIGTTSITTFNNDNAGTILGTPVAVNQTGSIVDPIFSTNNNTGSVGAAIVGTWSGSTFAPVTPGAASFDNSGDGTFDPSQADFSSQPPLPPVNMLG